MVGHHCVPSHRHDCQDSDNTPCLLRVTQITAKEKYHLLSWSPGPTLVCDMLLARYSHMTHDHENNKKLMGKLACKVLLACCHCPGLLAAAEGFLLCNYSPALAALPV